MELSKQQMAMAAFAIMDQLSQAPKQYTRHVMLEVLDMIKVINPVLDTIPTDGMSATAVHMETLRMLVAELQKEPPSAAQH